MSTRSKGRHAENIAIKLLLDSGYEIITRNYTVWGNEIDIVALQKNELVFIEVKSIIKQPSISMFELISKQKLKLLYRAIEVYLNREQPLQYSWRLDFIGIELSDTYKPINIEHLKRIGDY